MTGEEGYRGTPIYRIGIHSSLREKPTLVEFISFGRYAVRETERPFDDVMYFFTGYGREGGRDTDHDSTSEIQRT